jgi:hypothetical protein
MGQAATGTRLPSCSKSRTLSSLLSLSALVAQRGFAARWGSQSWLQPAFQPALLDCVDGGAGSKPAAGRIACPTIRRGAQRNEDLVVQVSRPVSPYHRSLTCVRLDRGCRFFSKNSVVSSSESPDAAARRRRDSSADRPPSRKFLPLA